jgi:hypothetical protein
MQSGASPTTTETQKKISTTLHNTQPVTNIQNKCLPINCIHVSFGCNQKLAHCRATITGSVMQSGGLATETENQKHTS